MSSNSDINCIIICGGQSIRMGRDKAFVQYHVLPQYLHLKKLVEPICSEICFSINEKQILQFKDEKFIVDNYDFNGPLNGLLTAFDAYPTSHVMLIGIDYPLITLDDLTTLIENKKTTDDVICYFNEAENIFEPLVALYDARCGDLLHQYVSNSNRPSIQGFLKSAKVQKINLDKSHNIVSFDKNNSNELESSKKISIVKYNDTFFGHKNDVVSVEEPLEIRLIYGPLDNRVTHKVAITMRTPGSDELLALGFLYNEGIIERHSDVMKVMKNTYHKGVLNSNIITIALLPNVVFDDYKLQRNFYTTSSCGICGKSSIEAIQLLCNHQVKSDVVVSPEELLGLSSKLRERQILFELTGGIHAVALFINQEMIAFAEDVGRHNAMDKLTGHLLDSQVSKLDNSILLLSGRASFELLQKAAVNGIPIVCAVGAPSSLAVDMAIDFNITLVGFLRDHSFNIYSHTHRIKSKS